MMKFKTAEKLCEFGLERTLPSNHLENILSSKRYCTELAFVYLKLQAVRNFHILKTRLLLSMKSHTTT